MSTITGNPLLARVWNTPYQIPPFGLIRPEHFKEAFPVGIAEHNAEIKSIVENNLDEPTFERVVAAFDRSGTLLKRTRRVFENLCSSCSSPELQAVQREFAGPLAAHESDIYMSGLFGKIDILHSRRDELGLTPEQKRLVERIHLDFIRSGACLDATGKERYKSIMERLAVLTTQFTQNILGDESEVYFDLSEEGALAGLPDFLVAACRSAAAERNVPGCTHLVTLSRSLVVPFLTFSSNSALREKVWRSWTSRGELDPARDNRPIALEILNLRLEQAKYHSFESYASYALADTMAGTPGRVNELLQMVWAPAKKSAEREATALLAKAQQLDPGVSEINPWDWRYYSELVRKEKFDINEADIKPYFSLEKMCEAIFDCAGKLFGLEFVRRDDFPVYHPDVAAYEVWRNDESSNRRLIGIFLHDNFSRPFKSSGAWMSSYQIQSKNVEDACNGATRLPIVVNNNNFAKAPEGESTLLSFDDARTLFHEFGHGLHGLLSNVTYQTLSGTSVLLDFVELPSQLYEHWLSETEVLKQHAISIHSGEPIPDQLLERMTAARQLNQGFDTVEYTASAFLDLKLHEITCSDELRRSDIRTVEEDILKTLDMPKGISYRHRGCHFQHLFSTSMYAAGYYSYLWAEVLDADAFEAFKETGNVFDRETSARVLRYIYSSGNSIEPGQAFRSFRGRDPVVEPMLKKKGLVL